MTREQIFNAISIIKKYGLQLHVPLIIGAPYETLEMMEENFRFAKEINAECMLFPILMPLPKTEIRKICQKEGLIEEEKFSGAHVMYTKPVVRTKYVNREDIAKFVSKVRRYLIVKYFLDGIKMKGALFLLDILIFLFYYKPRYNLEIDNAWKFTIHKYSLEKIRLERHLI
jgi:radical SAM superfamily enzyme YgiQ (UPF0313 family)